MQPLIALNALKMHHVPDRLYFPRKDDSSLVAGVGRRHFFANDSATLKTIINP